ncbi:MAG: hypothetical protein HC896_00055 [Bacteroidales bacterium]|nr:hypothetical protein [Bacteroidales bacterium]
MDFKKAVEKARKYFKNRQQNTLYVATDGAVFIAQPDADGHAAAIGGKVHIVKREDLEAKPGKTHKPEVEI